VGELRKKVGVPDRRLTDPIWWNGWLYNRHYRPTND
jgi:hypothetical protein